MVLLCVVVMGSDFDDGFAGEGFARGYSSPNASFGSLFRGFSGHSLSMHSRMSPSPSKNTRVAPGVHLCLSGFGWYQD